MDRLKIIIVGGGIAGLAMARACQLVGFSVLVLEKCSTIENIGGGITLYPHGFLGLKALNLENSLLTSGQFIKHFKVSFNREVIIEGTLDEFKNDVGVALFSVARHELQSILARSLDFNTIRFGARVTDVRSDEIETSIKLESGEKLYGDLIVLCDGIKSRTPNTNDLRYCGYSFWGGFLNGNFRAKVPEFSLDQTVGENKLAFILTLPNKRQWWQLVAKIPLESIDRVKNIQLAKELFSNWCPIVDQILRIPDELFSFGRPCFEKNFQQIFYSDHTVGIGDAVHAMGPTSGQGASTAIVEAITLTNALKTKTSIIAALESYSKQMNPVISGLYELEKKSSDTKMADDPSFILSRNQSMRSSTVNMLLEAYKPFVRAHSNALQQFVVLAKQIQNGS